MAPRTKSVDLDALLDESGNELARGHGIRTLGPSDSSDTGADMVGIGGLDQAEEAQLGITDEEIARALRERAGLEQD